VPDRDPAKVHKWGGPGYARAVITIDPGDLGSFGNGQLTLATELGARKASLDAVALGGDGLGEADPGSSFRTSLSTATQDMVRLVGDLMATLEVDGEALLLVAAQNIEANTGDSAGGTGG